jgi:hypothetical protein
MLDNKDNETEESCSITLKGYIILIYMPIFDFEGGLK